jgi:hypothetical protein
MSFFNKLFQPRQAGSPRKILATIHPFTRAAFLLVPAEAYEADELKTKHVLAFLYGALDVLLKQQHLTDENRVKTVETYLTLAFPKMRSSDIDSALTFVIGASAEPQWAPTVQDGRQALLDWAGGDSVAPARLVKIVHYGLETSN